MSPLRVGHGRLMARLASGHPSFPTDQPTTEDQVGSIEPLLPVTRPAGAELVFFFQLLGAR
jgi:hypothetical protein